MSDVPFLQGEYRRSVHEDSSVTELHFDGALPPELTGWYFRNGPNPRNEGGDFFAGETGFGESFAQSLPAALTRRRVRYGHSPVQGKEETR
jgi:hypothetical protein